RALADRMLEDFADDAEGGFFYTADDHESLIARTKDAVDNVLPSGNSVAVLDLLALARATKEPRYLDAAGKALDAFSPQLAQAPAFTPWLPVAVEEPLDARPGTGPVLDPLSEGGPLPGGIKDVVTAKVERLEPKVSAGRKVVELTLSLTVKDGWHVYAN